MSTLYYLQISYHLSTLKHLKLINVLSKTINLFFFCFSAVDIVQQEPFENHRLLWSEVGIRINYYYYYFFCNVSTGGFCVDVCSNSRKCRKLGDFYSCLCKQGKKGPNCEDTGTCAATLIMSELS